MSEVNLKFEIPADVIEAIAVAVAAELAPPSAVQTQQFERTTLQPLIQATAMRSAVLRHAARSGVVPPTWVAQTGRPGSWYPCIPKNHLFPRLVTMVVRFGFQKLRVTPLIENIRCAECSREVDEFTAIAEKWGYWSDGAGGLAPLCPECARSEFAPDARSSEPWLRVRHRDASTSNS